MKIFKTILFLVSILFIGSLGLQSCSKDEEGLNEGEAAIVFGYTPVGKDHSDVVLKNDSNKESHISNKDVTSKTKGSVNPMVLPGEPSRLWVKVTDASNIEIFRGWLPLHMDDLANWVTEPQVLKSGSLSIIEYIVVDAANNTLLASPKEGSPMSGGVIDPLPHTFDVPGKSTVSVKPEVLWAVDKPASSFGYLSYEFITDDVFEVLAYITAEEEVTEGNVIIKSNDNSGKVLFEGDIEAINPDVLKVKTDESGTMNYFWIVSKPGYVTQEFTKTYNEMKTAEKTAIEISMEKSAGIKYWVPDAKFREALKMAVPNSFDETDSLIYNTEEVLTLKELNVQSKGIESLDGIQFFVDLEKLHCQDNAIVNINLQGLVELSELNCSNNRLTALNLNSNKKLRFLICVSNQITTLSIDKCKYIQILIASNNQIPSLSLLSNPNVVWLEVNNNKITNLDISNIKNFKYLYLLTEELVSGENLFTELKVNTVYKGNSEVIKVKNYQKDKVKISVWTNSSLDANPECGNWDPSNSSCK